MTSRYPRIRDAARPFRLWDAKTRTHLRWRNYTDQWRAMDGALREAHWSGVGRSIEVVDVRYGRLLAVYTRGARGLDFEEFVTRKGE